MAIVMQFSFFMALNGVATKMEFYSRLPMLHNVMVRFILSTTYTFIGALCIVGYIYAFRETHHFTGGQFMLLWMTVWLSMHISFLVIDIIPT